MRVFATRNSCIMHSLPALCRQICRCAAKPKSTMQTSSARPQYVHQPLIPHLHSAFLFKKTANGRNRKTSIEAEGDRRGREKCVRGRSCAFFYHRKIRIEYSKHYIRGQFWIKWVKITLERLMKYHFGIYN